MNVISEVISSKRQQLLSSVFSIMVLMTASRKHNAWNGQRIRDLDISRQTFIVMVQRNGVMLVPKGDLMLLEGDHIVMDSQERISNASKIDI